MNRMRFISLDQVLGGYIKTFFWIWVILFFIIFMACGANKWAFWSGLGLGFLIAIPVYWILTILTGFKGGKI